MSYQVLARKWRPRTFQDLVGQEHVLRVLMNALSRNRLHHAYLFAGTRGVGKTTLARIFAKCLNCERALSAHPCGTCTTCRAIDAGQFLDLYEIDAASRTKVEDTRDLLENVAYPPVQGRYKVYLIDEVHMLSTHSFNALLKTLEEPPPQVLFIFATTEPKRLPITVLSRCLQFHLKQITPDLIEGQLEKICESEQLAYDKQGLALLATAADGSLRDALSLLDQAIVYCDGTLSFDLLKTMLGYITQDEVLRLLQALAEQDGALLFQALAALKQRSPDYRQVLTECLTLIQQAAVYQQVPTPLVSKAIQELAAQISAEDLQLYYQIALLGQKDLPYAPSPAQGFEMTMLRILAFHPLKASSALVPTPASQPTPLSAPRPLAAARETPALRETAVKAAAAPSQPTVSPPMLLKAAGDWELLLPQLGLTGMANALALNCQMESMSETQLSLVLAQGYKPMLNPKLLERIEQALSRHFNRAISVKIRITEDEIHTPAKQQEQNELNRKASALEALQQNSAVQKLQSLFNATLDAQSLELGD